MKKGIIKAVVLGLVFAAAIVFFGYYTNQNGVNMTTEMPQPSFPVVSVSTRNYEVARLYGYAREMDMTSMRGPIVPVDQSRSLEVSIRAYGEKIDAVAYEIRSMDGSRLIAETSPDYSQNGTQDIRFDVTLENLLEEGQEYQLVFSLGQKDPIRYYARVIQDSSGDVEHYLEFARSFSDATFSSDGETKVSTYLEPDGTQAGDLHYVNIHSSVSMVCWGDFEGSVVSSPVFTLRELNSSYAVITADYVLDATGESGELEYYNVNEYYRVSYNEASNRCYLHNYERSVNQIFRTEGEIFKENQIQLGIRDGQVAYKKSENQKITCFEQQGEIWSYNETTKLLTRIFSFRGFEGMDERENNPDTKAYILNVDEGGSVNYAVSGYMSRGIHEGEVGIGIYHFDSLTMTVEETLFIESTQAEDRLFVDNEDMIYQNPEGNLFLLYQGNLIRVGAMDNATSVLAKNLHSGEYLFDSEHHLFAWLDEEGSLQMLDLEKEETSQLAAVSGDQYRLLGFLEGDLVYGSCHMSDPVMANHKCPMYQLTIYDPIGQKERKSYEKNGSLIADVDIQTSVITMNRVRWSEDGYTQIEPDSIMNQEGANLLDQNISTYSDDRQGSIVQLALDGEVDVSKVKLVTSKEIKLEKEHNLQLDFVEAQKGYYIYAYGRCSAYESELADAIRSADEQSATVVDETMQYAWKRAKQLTVAADTTGFLRTDLAGNVEQILPTEVVCHVAGCDLTQVFYYISQGDVVLATDSEQNSYWLVGYDTATVAVYDPASGQIMRQSIEEMQKIMNRAGNPYIVYAKNK